jgi:hypothetical protein
MGRNSKVMEIDSLCFNDVALEIIFLFYTNAVLDFAKNVLPPLEPEILIMSERIGKSTKRVYVMHRWAPYSLKR